MGNPTHRQWLNRMQDSGSSHSRYTSPPAYTPDNPAASRSNPDCAPACCSPTARAAIMRGGNVRRRWWSDALAAALLLLHTGQNKPGEDTSCLRLQDARAEAHLRRDSRYRPREPSRPYRTCSDTKSVCLTLDRYGHRYPSEVDPVGSQSTNVICGGLTPKCAHG